MSEDTNLIDVILGVSVETDDKDTSIDDLLKQLDKLAGHVVFKDGADDESSEEAADAASQASKDAKDAKKSSDDAKDSADEGKKTTEDTSDETQEDIERTREILWNKIDQIWQNISTDASILKGSTGRITFAKSLIDDPEATLTANKMTRLMGTKGSNQAGLMRVLNVDTRHDIKNRLLEIVEGLGYRILEEEMSGNTEAAQKLMDTFNAMGLKTGAIETSKLSELINMLIPEKVFHTGLGAGEQEYQKERIKKGSLADVTFEDTAFKLFMPKMGTNLYKQATKDKDMKEWSPREFAMLKDIEDSVKDIDDREERMKEFNEQFEERFGETFKDFMNSNSVIGMVTNTMGDIIKDVFNLTTSLPERNPDMFIKLKKEFFDEEVTRDRLEEALREPLEKQRGNVNEEFFQGYIDKLLPSVKRMATDSAIAFTREFGINPNAPKTEKEFRTSPNVPMTLDTISLPTKQAMQGVEDERVSATNIPQELWIRQPQDIETMGQIQDEQRRSKLESALENVLLRSEDFINRGTDEDLTEMKRMITEIYRLFKE